jgi:hypothetical protein
MNKRAEFLNHNERYKYAKAQLRKRRRELNALELKPRLLILPSERRSCRRSLLQAIDELEILLRIKAPL